MDEQIAYCVLKKVAQDELYCKELLDNCDEVLKQEGIVEPADIEELKGVLSRFAGQATTTAGAAESVKEFSSGQLKETSLTADRFKRGLRETIDQIDAGFRITGIMYQVSFYAGILLILSSIPFAFLGKGSLLSIVFAGVGAADVIAFLVTNPPLQLQKSRADLAQL